MLKSKSALMIFDRNVNFAPIYDLLIIHSASGSNNVVITGKEKFTSTAGAKYFSVRKTSQRYSFQCR